MLQLSRSGIFEKIKAARIKGAVQACLSELRIGYWTLNHADRKAENLMALRQRQMGVVKETFP